MPTPIRSLTVGSLPVEIFASNDALGQAAAQRAGTILRAALAARGEANLILATGNSQLTTLGALRSQPELDWSRVRVFHMDEYAGMGPDHPASFRRFLREKIIGAIQPAAFFGIHGEAGDIQAECARYAGLLAQFPADLCCLGIGENGHLAFNDPPYADFNDPAAVKVVALAEKSRRQQVGEGHFATLADVPAHALTLTITALLSAKAMLCMVPEARKAEAVRAALTGPVGEDCPASILRSAGHCRLYLDVDSAGLVMDLEG